MYSNFKKLLYNPVVTESGENLGVLTDIVFEVESLEVIHIIVRPRFLSRLFSSSFLQISREQIISIETDKITVTDNSSKEKTETAPDKAHEQFSAEPA